jgi:hypothetical protein
MYNIVHESAYAEVLQASSSTLPQYASKGPPSPRELAMVSLLERQAGEDVIIPDMREYSRLEGMEASTSPKENTRIYLNMLTD